MTIFDLLFLVVFLASVITLVTAAIAAARGQGHRAMRTLGSLGIALVVYFGILVAVSVTSSPRSLAMNEPQCSDDWCIAVDQVERTSAGSESSYAVTLRLFSRARGRPQRETGVGVHLVDASGRRYEPAADPQAVPFDVLLDPGQSVLATRTFTLPADARDVGLVVTHGRFPGMFIITDDGSLFHAPSVVRLQ